MQPNEDQEYSLLQLNKDHRVFVIEHCVGCGRTPALSRHDDHVDALRYSIQCCSGKVNAFTQTQCIVNWNLLQSTLSPHDPEQSEGRLDIYQIQ